MDTPQPAGGQRTLPAVVPWLSAGIVLVALVAVGLIVKGHTSSAALTRCPTPTPTAFATGGGAAAIKPDKHLAALCLGPSTPSFTAAEAAAFTAKYSLPGLHPAVRGSKFTVISAKFMSAAAAGKLLGTDFVRNGLSANQVVCVVQVSGRFNGPLGPGGKPTFMDTAYAIYDGNTGNLLATMGIVAGN
jgi:hypothetical protein